MKVGKYRERLENEVGKCGLERVKKNTYLREIACNLYAILQELKKHE